MGALGREIAEEQVKNFYRQYLKIETAEEKAAKDID